ncbi:MAG: cyclohexanone monooxygenase, partial [Pseudomonadales bacterium]
QLVDIKKTPIETLTEEGLQTSAAHYDLDVLIFATGFNAITGGFEKIDISGVDGQRLADKWRDGPSTYLGLTTQGFPNLMMVAGPQSISGSTNFPRAIEGGVEWASALVEHARAQGYTRFDVKPDAEAAWGKEVAQAFEKLLARNSKGWFTGYNSNVAGHEAGTVRYQAYFGGGPKYGSLISDEATAGYPGLTLS